MSLQFFSGSNSFLGGINASRILLVAFSIGIVAAVRFRRLKVQLNLKEETDKDIAHDSLSSPESDTNIDQDSEFRGEFPTDLKNVNSIIRLNQNKILGELHKNGQRVEILIHNIGHKDLVLGLSKDAEKLYHRISPIEESSSQDWSNRALDGKKALARPRFSLFQETSKLVLSALDKLMINGIAPLAYVPREPQDKNQNMNLRNEAATVLPAGFDISSSPVPVHDLNRFRIKVRDEMKLRSSIEYSHEINRESNGDILQEFARCQQQEEVFDPEVHIIGAYFPLISSLVPKWKRQIIESGDATCEKVIYLVSGVGGPRHQSHQLEGNSTEGTSRLMERFLALTHKDVRVVRVHSRTNLFRYDENIRFVKMELIPLVDAERQKIYQAYGSLWKDMMHVTISFADGSPARISSISASMRHYRPSYMHIWKLKTFWYDGYICEDDVEVHTFEDINTAPPVPVTEVDVLEQMVVAEMRQFRDDFALIHSRGLKNDLSQFWLRKTRKPVLSVLLVQKAGQEPKIYRGTNMEVSMPTGSLCAERNVIGSALAADLTLCRQDLHMIAVLGVSLSQINVEHNAPRGFAYSEEHARSASVGTRSNSECSISNPVQFGPENVPQEAFRSLIGSHLLEEYCKDRPSIGTRGIQLSRSRSPATPGRKPGHRKQLVRSLCRGGVQMVDSGFASSNPLKPCGSCTEWLRKIAEVNPDFKVLTFTDVSCEGVYIESVAGS